MRQSDGAWAPQGPTPARFVLAQVFCYNFGRAVGTKFPFLIGYVSQTMTLGHAIGVFAAAAYGVVIVAALMLPETKGRQLSS